MTDSITKILKRKNNIVLYQGKSITKIFLPNFNRIQQLQINIDLHFARKIGLMFENENEKK